MKAYIGGVELQLLSFLTDVLDSFIYLYTYIQWIIRGKPHLDIGIANRHGCIYTMYEGHLESKERFAIKKYLLIIGKKTDMQFLSHTFTYFST